jgi:heme/copper-type cytochrome/quinol oxidase subunit 2
MSTPMVITRTHRPYARPTLRTITVAALVVNALLFLFDVFSTGPDSINLTHIAISLVVAGIVAIRFRWAPALGALLFGLQVVEGYLFLGHMLTEPDTTVTFAFAAIFFATTVVGLVAGVGATVQNYRAAASRPFVDQPAPPWTYPAMLALAALALGGILSTAIQPRGVLPSFSPQALAALPALTAKDFLFDQPKITAKVGETVVLRLDNADTTTHYLDIDEFNVHALIPPGKSNVTLFKPTQPGTYTFYCHPHADKAAGTGMVGTLIVAP